MLIRARIKNLSYSKQIQQLLEQKNYSKKKSLSKNIFDFLTKWHFEKSINRMNEGYMEIKLWKLSACIKQKFYCFEDFTEPLAFFV